MIEFSAIISAVKRNKRTDQYMILSALYFLGADKEPVKSRKITDLLKRHDIILSNVTASLRSYTGFVEKANDKSPFLWRLTKKGLSQLRTLTGLELQTDVKDESYETDIAFVCALEHPEFSSLQESTGGKSSWSVVGQSRYAHVYEETQIHTDDGHELNVVGTVATSMGLTAAAIATTQLILQFRPRLVVMVGIAAGTRGGNKEFGDILVADPSVDYNSGKVVIEGGIREFLPDPYPIGLNARLRSVIQKYRAPNNDLFAELKKQWNGNSPNQAIRLHLGPLGAADQVIDDETRIEEIRKNWRKLIGVEMETYGVYRACHEAPAPAPRFVSFKSVCDFAAQKTDSWQAYAAFTSSRFAIEFIKREWNAIWPDSKS